MVTVIEDAGSSVRSWSRYGLQVAARWTQDPTRDEVRAALQDVGPEGVLVSGTAATLNIVVDGLRRSGSLSTPVGFLPALPAKGAPEQLVNSTLDLAQRFGLSGEIEATLAAEPVRLALARNDIGGVLLIECLFQRPRLARFGAQTYHDDQLITDGPIRSLAVLPQYGEHLELRAIVTPTSGRKRTATTQGRAVQTACDPVRMWVDGRDSGEVEGRTWYVDEREHWYLRGARGEQPPADPQGTSLLARLLRR